MTERQERLSVTTDWDGRDIPTDYYAELQDAYWIVHDEDNEIVYIYSSSWTAIPWTRWTTRPLISNND